MRNRSTFGAMAGAIALLLFVASTSFARTTVDDTAQGLTCQCGCGLTVANCNMPTCGFSVPMREEIAAMIDKGMDRPAIISFYRHKYGEKVLSAPTTEGFNLLAWIMPFAAIAAGGGLIVMVLGRWRNETMPQTPTEERAPTIDPKLRAQLDAEVRKGL
ncbi:MAG TPA: cytochrome c-type biogenesis protein [Candidatus Binataceae bacterium]|nr:cytochrome c-type biogenesis protein [Candidatus Binataceae bacterium]